MLKHGWGSGYDAEKCQPPSGGCVLKLAPTKEVADNSFQPPSGGCVLKQKSMADEQTGVPQPPSGGCVLKPLLSRRF